MGFLLLKIDSIFFTMKVNINSTVNLIMVMISQHTERLLYVPGTVLNVLQ